MVGLLVALFTRAWIEISPNIPARNIKIVALFTRAWIEMEGTAAPQSQ